MAWPNYTGSGCGGLSARTMLNAIISTASTAPNDIDPEWQAIRAAATLCRSNTNHGAHGTLNDAQRYSWTCAAYTRMQTQVPPDLAAMLNEVNHGGGGGGGGGGGKRPKR